MNKAKKKKITMQMIADEVSVSVTTVSHVLNRSRFVAEDLRKKILDCAEQLGYTKKHSVQRSKSKVNCHIGLIVSDIHDADLFLDIIQISEAIARKYGYTVLVGDAENSREKEAELVRNFLAKQVHGLLIASNFSTADELEKIKGFQELPVVLLDRRWQGKHYDFVGIDNFRTAFDLTRALIGRKGVQSFGCLGVNIHASTMQERENGCRTAMLSENRGGSYGAYWLDLMGDVRKQILNFCYGEEPGRQQTRQGKYHVLCCLNTNICSELLRVLKVEDLDPREFHIVTFDDSVWLDFLPVALTVIRQPAADISITAVNLLMEKIRTQQNHKAREVGRGICLPVEIIQKEPWELGTTKDTKKHERGFGRA